MEKLESEVKNLCQMHELEAQWHDQEKIEMMESSTEEIEKQLKQERQKILRRKMLLEGWVRMQKNEIEQVINCMKNAEREVHDAAAEWRRLFCNALELRVGEIGQELNADIESLDRQDNHDPGFIGCMQVGKKRVRKETSNGGV